MSSHASRITRPSGVSIENGQKRDLMRDLREHDRLHHETELALRAEIARLEHQLHSLQTTLAIAERRRP